MKLPAEFTEKMRDLLGDDEYQAFYRALREKVITHCLRINTAKITVEEFLRIFPYPLKEVPWCRQAFYLPKGFKASKHPYYHAGLYYLQEPSAVLPGVLLDPQPGEKVLDLCAAPGGKTTQIGAAMKNRGLLFANDVNPRRLQALLKNVENFGIHNIIILNEKPEALAARFPRYFDRVLVDAPCSGEGMFRREPRLTTAWRRNYHPKYCVPLQRDLLKEAAKMVAPGGMLVYSTCTFSPEEDERQVAWFLETHPDFHPAVLPELSGVSPGRGEWAGYPDLTGTVRIWPHLARGEGHFTTVLRREGEKEGVNAGDGEPPFLQENIRNRNRGAQTGDNTRAATDARASHGGRAASSGNLHEPTTKAIAAFHNFCTQVGIEPPGGWFPGEQSPGKRWSNKRMPEMPGRRFSAHARYKEEEGKLYLLPSGLPDLRGLKVIRNGLFLGEYRGGDFKPAAALALALERQAAVRELDFPPGSPELARYLRGETLLLDGDRVPGNGWVLIKTSGFPLGWAKRLGRLLRNEYPPSWRIR
ncbi:MAG TPA: rRNA cytosine-C5-methyltransferase [Firmicutes bacterium]|jgi:NOL1/NOP2/sun family putative RNA methylase|nr:rRNA cytosine-C5-methyltransferase [Bacillota bacterium]